MAGFTDLLERALLDHLFTDPAYAPPATLYLGLSSTTPTEAGGNVTEPGGGAYARIGTTAADWSAASGVAPAVKTNTAILTFPTATADWLAGVNLTHCLVFDALAAGNLLAWGAVAVPRPVLSGDLPSFQAAALIVALGDPSDVYP